MAETTLTTEQLKEFEREFVTRVWNGRDLDLVDDMTTDDYVGHWFGFEEEDAEGPEGLKAFIGAVHEGFSDFEMEIEFLVAEDDTVVVGFTTTGTHDGEFMGIPPTEKTGEPVPGIYVHRFEGEQVAEAWAAWDALGLLQDLGVVPESFHLADFFETALNLTKQDLLKRTARQG